MDAEDDDLDPEVLRYFDPEQFVNCYRQVIAQRDAAAPAARVQFDATIRLMKQRWEEYDGDDQLHEMAFGEPFGEDDAQIDLA